MPDWSDRDGAVIIVGAGQAGGRAAEALRLGGYGGPITVVGEEAHPPYERPSLSKEFLHEPDPAKIAWIRPHGWYEDNDVTLTTGKAATRIDRAVRTVILADGTELQYRTLVIATGTRPRLLSVEGADHSVVQYLRTIGDSQKLQGAMKPGSDIVVVGAGFIGLEVAAAARTRGANVVVLEMAPLPMGRAVPPRIGEFFARFHATKGVDLRLGTRLRRIVDRGGKAAAELADGSLLPADAIVVGIGVLPNVELAAEAGLKVENGIVVDEYGRTDDPDIYAAGDVTSHFNPLLGRTIRLESWQNAQNQAIAVAGNIMGAGKPYAEIPWFWSDQFDLNLQIAGVPQPEDVVVMRGSLDEGPTAMFHLRGGKLEAVIGIGSPREVRFGKEIIASGGKISAAELASPDVNLSKLVRDIRASIRR